MRCCWSPGFGTRVFPRVRPAYERLLSSILRYPLVMAQDPEREEEQPEGQPGGDVLLTSHALDMVTLWSSSTVSAEMEADMIRGVLESNDIPVMVVGASQYPNLGFEVKVPRGKVKEAEELIEQAEAAGPDAATEAEAESEK